MQLFAATARCACAAFAVLLAGTSALAQGQAKALVLPLDSDFLPAALVETFEQEIRKEVASALKSYALMPRPRLDFASMKLAAGCTQDGPSCLKLIGQATRARLVVQVEMRGSIEQASLQVRRVYSRSGKQSIYEAPIKDIGPDSTQEIGWHVATALGARPPPLKGRIVLDVKVPRSGLGEVTLLLDGRRVARAALEQVVPGRHRLAIQKPGYAPLSISVEVRPGRQTQIPITLARLAPPPSETTAAGPSTVEGDAGGPFWAWILGPGAVAAAGTATVFAVQVQGLESDAEEARLDCGGRDRQADICADGRARALMTNVTWGVAGALAVGAVVAYFVEDDDDADASAHIGVSPTPGGVAAALEVSF